MTKIQFTFECAHDPLTNFYACNVLENVITNKVVPVLFLYDESLQRNHGNFPF